MYICFIIFDHNNSDKFHDHLRVHTFHLNKPDSMFFEISRRLTFGQSFRKLVLSKCPNVWTITMIYRIFMTFREYVRVPKMYLDNQPSKCIEISWRYPFRLSFRKIVLTKNYYKIIIGSLTLI